MDARKKLFKWKELYNHKETDQLFLHAIRQNAFFHEKKCKPYRRILKLKKFTVKDLDKFSNLHKLPPIPTLYLKNHNLISIPERKMIIKATSSGTSGRKSSIGFDLESLQLGFHMVKKVVTYHKLISILPTNYIILGYQPNKTNQAIIAKTAFGATLFAPALNREYALTWSNGSYKLNFERLKKKLLSYERLPFPVRLIGFPSYLYFFLLKLKKSGITVKLKKGSKIFLGGGWKELSSYQVEKEVLYGLIYEILGIPKENCIEFFGVAEHPIIYCNCKNHHFHVPTYSRVIIRDVNTLEPVKNGTIGLLNLITPMVYSSPLLSIMTDDLAVLHDGKKCGCGIATPYFEILGRVGVKDIKTCAASAMEHIGEGDNHDIV